MTALLVTVMPVVPHHVVISHHAVMPPPVATLQPANLRLANQRFPNLPVVARCLCHVMHKSVFPKPTAKY